MPGLNAGRGKDDTIFAKIDGKVRFEDHGAQGPPDQHPSGRTELTGIRSSSRRRLPLICTRCGLILAGAAGINGRTHTGQMTR